MYPYCCSRLSSYTCRLIFQHRMWPLTSSRPIRAWINVWFMQRRVSPSLDLESSSAFERRDTSHSVHTIRQLIVVWLHCTLVLVKSNSNKTSTNTGYFRSFFRICWCYRTPKSTSYTQNLRSIARIEMVSTRGVAYALPSTADTVNLNDMNVEVQRWSRCAWYGILWRTSKRSAVG